MFVPIASLLGRRQPRSRRAELKALRAAFSRARADAAAAGTDEIAGARRMRELRTEIAADLAEVEACGGCTRRFRGPFDGGLCCSGATHDVFTSEEIAALSLAGTRSRDLRVPNATSPHVGCAFRGATGCTLTAANRPSVCIRYLCGELRRELAKRGDLLDIDRRCEELASSAEQVAKRRAERLARAEEAELLAAFGLSAAALEKPSALQ